MQLINYQTAAAVIRGVTLGVYVCTVYCECAGAATDTEITATATSDYDFRGESQTRRQPAAQIALDSVKEGQWHVGVFASNVNFGPDSIAGNPQLEISPVVELIREIHPNTTVTVGAAYFLYTIKGGAPYDFGEVEVGITHRWFTTTLFFTPAYDGRANEQRHSAQYWSSDLTIPALKDLSFVAHLGYSWGPYWRDVVGQTTYDGSLGITISFHHFDLKLQQIFHNSIYKRPDPGAVLAVTSRTIISVSRSIPMH